jgi:ribonucleoside-diphosphate reductase alpha chain
VFPRWKESAFAKGWNPILKSFQEQGTGDKLWKVRNVAITTIAPTGTISMAADTSSGIEPVFALSYVKNVVDEAGLNYTDSYFAKAIDDNQALAYEVAKQGSCQHVAGIPEGIKKVFVTAHDIPWEWHVKMQAAFQEFTDNAVSKTINLPKSAGIEEIKQVYMKAWKAKCKGITVYRDQSKEYQVLGTSDKGQGTSNKKENYIIQSKIRTKTLKERAQEGLVHDHKTTVCPECGGEAALEEGCVLCHNCGWSACSA